MLRPASLALALWLVAPALAQEISSDHRRPAVCFGAWTGCATCDDVRAAVEALPARYDERAAADVVTVEPDPGEGPHRHVVYFFSRAVPRLGLQAGFDGDRVLLQWRDVEGRPTDGEDGMTVVEHLGRALNDPGDLEVHADLARSEAFALLHERLLKRRVVMARAPYGLPVMIDADPRVPSRMLRAAIDETAELYDRAFRMLPRAPESLPLTRGWDPRAARVSPEDDAPPTSDGPQPQPEQEPAEDPQVTIRPATDEAPPAEAPEGAHQQRWGKEPLRAEGGSEGTESAVSAALRWLDRHQAPDGHWSSARWDTRCAPLGGGPGHNQGDARYDVGVTALALLAHLGNGHTHRWGRFREGIARGLTWLARRQREDGSIGFDPTHGESTYNHALATQALCEAYAITRDPALRPIAGEAVGFVLVAQNPGLGWKYGVRSGRNDTSATAMMALALDAAKTAGFEVPEAATRGARNWFARATAASGEVGYETPGGGSAFLALNDGKFDPLPAMTAAALFTRRKLGQPAAEPILVRCAERVAAAPPASKDRQRHYYYWYYGTQAMFQQGGEPWAAWNQAILRALLPGQRQGGCADGSWDPTGEWCLAGGRVYATAINALTLETYYRFPRQP